MENTGAEVVFESVLRAVVESEACLELLVIRCVSYARECVRVMEVSVSMMRHV